MKKGEFISREITLLTENTPSVINLRFAYKSKTINEPNILKGEDQQTEK